MLKTIPLLQKGKIARLVFHHFGGLAGDPYAKTSHLTLAHLERAHGARWPDFRSSVGFLTGYTAVIWTDGSLTQTRLVGEETAAVIGWNKNTISIALAGNFTLLPNGSAVETPTHQQKETAQKVAEWTHEQFGIMPWQAVPHRALQATSCYGSALSDEWAKSTLQPYISRKISTLQTLVSLYAQAIALLQKKRALLGGNDFDCCGFVPMTLEEAKNI